MLSQVGRFFAEAKAPNPFARKVPPQNVKHIILAASCKGGVGKSTVAMNTAIALTKQGMRVGLFDADLYGPSVPTMTLTSDSSLVMTQENKFLPVYVNGLETVSIGNAVKKEDALLWKGPAVGGLITQLLKDSLWSELDYLIIDTPPGTGDVHLALYDAVPIDGAILVTSPQNVAMADVIRNVDMFKKMRIPVLGLVRNFDGFVCPCCGEVTKIFQGQKADEMAKENKYEVLGSIPIDPAIAKAADSGIPAIDQAPDSAYAKVFQNIAKKIIEKVPKDSKPRGTK
ncbi:mrp, putative [Trichomonas vaginalis G3]|uniref:Mrp, putative n=1 Tax=Trichomonas vaginalis (strain ATCC PRA-98 / G3) TaxID=412133 RepID=A2D9M0_TRIV3|nr:NUBPL iron-transfer P-loop NTPase (ParA) family [Trichomonas vaginalis G3]EAY22876.1 mrp, putative [Trichomonas vaginalis G3]KAI5527409.1 NUBPL iron-transfer P-loop NTPase (ParA) family [Trichomonas vaginalis G3]|eukprot:XP_001583862.1 mrp [Trichomonas vaginalis G3]